jgi:hypothetical protein
VRVILSAVLLCLLGRVGVVRAQDVSVEYRVKAAFVARFPEFVNWPPPAWQGRTTLDVCVLTPNPFGKDLPDILDGQVIGGRRVAIQEVQADSPLTPCHVLYVTKESSGRQEVLERAALLPILTISDAPKFLDSGGIIQLQTVNNRVRFEISSLAAARVGLRLSSQLLRLAVNVRSGP